jgi:sec-independent protein translocase protein TatC
MTPPDIISQVLMALPLMGLYELSILLSKIFGKKPTPVPSEGDGNKVESPAST